MPKLIGLTRVRNERMLIKEHLDHLGKYCDEVYVFDDGSTDGTLEIIQKHPQVTGYLANPNWHPSAFCKRDPLRLAWKNRKLFNFARRKSRATRDDWFLYIDSDERFEPDFPKTVQKILNQKQYDTVCFELYDFFITEEDKNLSYQGDITALRKYCGTEYRIQQIFFRNLPGVFFPYGTHREAFGFDPRRIWYSPFKIKHYGKAKSIEDYQKKSVWYKKYRKHSCDREYKFVKPAIRTDESDVGKLVKWEELKQNPNLRGTLVYKYNPKPYLRSKKAYFHYLWLKHYPGLVLNKIKEFAKLIIFYCYWKRQ